MNIVRRERKIQYVVKSFEKCHPPSASDLVKSVRVGRVGNNTCVLCLCGEALLMLSETITLKDAYTNTKLILRDLIQELNLTSAVSLLSVDLDCTSSQKVCKTCVNTMSSFYLFTNKCTKTAKAFKNIVRLVCNDKVNARKSRKKRSYRLSLPYEDIYKYVNESNIGCKDKTASPDEGPTNVHRECSNHTLKKYCTTENVSLENFEKTNNLQSKEANKKLTFDCYSCDERNAPWNKYIEHQDNQELLSYKSVVQNFARNKQFCICCLKVSNSLVRLSEQMIFKGLKMSASYEISLNEMINEAFHVSVMKEYHAALICEACIDRTVNTYSFLKMLEDSLFILKKSIIDIDSGLNKAVGGINYIHSPVHVYLDTMKYLTTKMESTTEVNRSNTIIESESNSRTACYNSELDVNSVSDKEERSPLLYSDITVAKNKCKYTSSDDTFSSLKGCAQHACILCNKKFASLKGLLSHSKRNHDTKIACESTKKMGKTLRKVGNTTVICECCNKIFHSKSLLKVHILNKNYALEDCSTSFCDICGEKFASKKVLRSHRDSTHKTLTQCSHCYKVVKDQYLLEKHIVACETMDKPFKCDMCDARFTSEDKMTFHRRKHFPRSFHCEFCPGKYWTKSELNGHLKRSHKHIVNTGTTLGRVYHCSMCTLDFSSKKERIIHTGSHPVDSKHICRICGESFKSKINYYGHLKRHNIKKDCKCSVCGKLYTKYNISNHMKSHRVKEDSAHVPDLETGKNETKIKTKMCDVCGRLLSNQASLMKHREIHKEQEQCPYCLNFVNSTIFDRHMRTHNGVLDSQVRKNERRSRKSFSCSKCDYTSMFAECLEAHENRFHLQVRPFKCDVCNKGFYAKITLKEHIKTHSGTKPEQCEQCGNRFVSKKALRLHVRIHTGEKPYKCDLCEEKFLSASRRQAHRTRKHFEPSVQCQICLKMYYTQSAVRIHIRDYHSAEPRQRSGKKRTV